MTNASASTLAKELFDKVTSIRINSPAGVFGTTSGQSMLTELVKSVGELGKAIQAAEPYETVIKRYEEAVSQVDGVAITGLIAESEAADYYQLVDDLWAAIEKERK